MKQWIKTGICALTLGAMVPASAFAAQLSFHFNEDGTSAAVSLMDIAPDRYAAQVTFEVSSTQGLQYGGVASAHTMAVDGTKKQVTLYLASQGPLNAADNRLQFGVLGVEPGTKVTQVGQAILLDRVLQRTELNDITLQVTQDQPNGGHPDSGDGSGETDNGSNGEDNSTGGNPGESNGSTPDEGGTDNGVTDGDGSTSGNPGDTGNTGNSGGSPGGSSGGSTGGNSGGSPGESSGGSTGGNSGGSTGGNTDGDPSTGDKPNQGTDQDTNGSGSSGSSGSAGSSSNSSKTPTVTIHGKGGKVSADRDGTVSITPDTGYRIARILVNGKEVEIKNKLTGLKATDKVEVTFEQIETQPPVSTAPSFTDVHETDWFAQAVQFVTARGLFQGDSANTFAPNANMNRAMLVTVLYRLSGQKATSASSFTDVPAGQWYSDAVAWAKANKIVSGVSDTQFAPNQNVTREQTAAILSRYSAYQGVSLPKGQGNFADQDQISPYAQEAVASMQAAGLIQGRENNRFAPQANITRAEVATILMRYVNMIES